MSNRSLSFAAGVVLLLVIAFLQMGRTVSDDASLDAVGGASRSVADRGAKSSDAARPESDEEQKTLAPESRATIVEEASESTASNTGPASLIVTAIWADDEVPVTQIGIWLIAWRDDDPFARQRTASTDADGRVRFDDVSPGKVTVGAALGGSDLFEVRPGMTESVELRLDPGILVRGLVVDEDERPVPGAEICAADVFDDHVVARTGGDGRFTLRGGQNSMLLSARSATFPPSPGYYVEGKKGDTFDVTLTLSGEVARLHGRVLDAQDHSVANAKVFIGERQRTSVDLEGDKQGTSPPPILAVTDRDGRWEAAGEVSDYVPLLVRATGFAPGYSLVSTEEGDLEVPDIHLERGVVVYGIARLANGDPVGEATVRSGRYGDLESSMSRTNAEGAFRVVDLPRTSAITVGGRDIGRATKSITAAPGEVVEWNPILDDGAVIRGIVLDEKSQPHVGWMIRVERSEGKSTWTGQATTDAKGHFIVRNCETDADLTLSLFEPKQSSPAPVRRVQPLRPDGPEIEIRVSSEDLPSAYVSGRVVDQEGAPVSEGSVSVWTEGTRSAGVHLLDKDGGFSIGPFSPGTMTVILDIGGPTSRLLGRFELVRNQHLDLGVLRPERPGRAILEPTNPDLADLNRHGISLWLDRIRVGTKFADGRWTSDDAQPGTYAIHCWHDNERSIIGTVNITSGETSTVRIDLKAGRDR